MQGSGDATDSDQRQHNAQPRHRFKSKVSEQQITDNAAGKKWENQNNNKKRGKQVCQKLIKNNPN